VFLYKTALAQVHIIKISVKLVEIVFFGEKSENPRDVREIPEIREKKFFPVFRTTQRQPISGKSGNFRENRIEEISRKSPKIRKIRNPENFGKVPKRRF
jgi:hypothetical protein